MTDRNRKMLGYFLVSIPIDFFFIVFYMVNGVGGVLFLLLVAILVVCPYIGIELLSKK